MVRRDIGPKIALKDQVGLQEIGLLVPQEIHTHEILMITTETGIPHHHWTDLDHTQTHMTEDHRHHHVTLTTETETHMQDLHQNTMEEGKAL